MVLNLHGMTRINDLPILERPREKALLNGVETLSNVELLALIISSGIKNKSSLDIGYELLSRFGSIEGLASLSINEIKEVSGLKDAKAIKLLASFELLKRYEKEIKRERQVIKSTSDVIDLILPRIINLDHEEFYLVYLNKNNELIRMERLYKGTKDKLTLATSDIIKAIFKAGATRVYIVHNHPSDNSSPSKHDLETYQTLTLFLSTCLIDLVDSIIIGNKTSYSCLNDKTYENKNISYK